MRNRTRVVSKADAVMDPWGFNPELGLKAGIWGVNDPYTRCGHRPAWSRKFDLSLCVKHLSIVLLMKRALGKINCHIRLAKEKTKWIEFIENVIASQENPRVSRWSNRFQPMCVTYQYYKINNDSLPRLLPISPSPPCSLHHYFPSNTGARLPRWLSGRESACQCRRCRRCGFHLWVRKIPWSRKWQPTPIFLPGKSHGQRRLLGYSP